MNTIKVGILGLGTVGSGVVKVLTQNAGIIRHKVGCNVEVEKILVKNPDKKRSSALGNITHKITSDATEILDNPEIKIVVEVMGGIEVARDYILHALENGKHVVTANKDLVSLYGKELFNAASKNKCDLFFEASVAGGIPIIRPLKECLAGNKIYKVMGIINGTTNYILTKMTKEGKQYEETLLKAQSLGYAESDPTADVEGYDAARKIAILASIAFGTRVTYQDVYVEGITNITARDIEYAKELGYAIKLLGIAKEEHDEVEVRVHPVFIPTNHPLSSVDDVFNAVFVEGDAVGETMFYGQGAGEFPTASAVVGDIISASRNIYHGNTGRICCTCFEQKKVKSIEDITSEFYIRLNVIDRPGVLASIAGVFGNQEVSLASVVQKRTENHKAEVVLITHRVKEGYVRDALKILDGMSIVDEISNVVRVEGGNRK
ncbi:MAG: homoserine dehydrogenase [Clostridia bacterium]|jgi:homoserine dehydrogenase|nr:homoserine dehydrogenase [Clostridia bacterium]